MELWSAPLPAWVEWLPQQIAAVLLLYMFSGSVLLFVEEGDLLFLRQHLHWMKGLMARGISYSITISVIKGVIFLLIILPFLYRGFQLDMWTILTWVMLASGTAWCTNLVVHRIRVTCTGFKQWFFSTILRVGSFFVYLIMLEVLSDKPFAIVGFWVFLMVLLLWIIRLRLSMKGSFAADVREDARTRMWLTDKLLVQAVGKVPPVRSKSWIFRKSGRIYRSSSPDKRFAGVGVKAFIRNSENLLLYVQFSVVAIPAIIFPPLVIKLIVLIALMFLLAYLLHLRWTAFAKHEFSLVLPFTDMQEKLAGTLAVRTLMIPPALIFSLAFTLSVWPSWIGGVAALPVALICAFSVPSFFSWPTIR